MITIDKKLIHLISLYEEENIRLQKLIDDCVEEKEYLMAHYHSEALNQLNGRLQNLRNVKDKLFDEKVSAKRTIDFYQNLIESESSGNIDEFFVNSLQSARKELEKMNQIPKQLTQPGNNTLLEETIKNLIENKIKNVKLILKKDDKLCLGFTYSNKGLKVSLPYIRQHAKKWILSEDKINSLKKLGFAFNEKATKLTLTLAGKKEEILKKVNIILSKIVFEIFYFKEFDNESYIEFTEKPTSKK